MTGLRAVGLWACVACPLVACADWPDRGGASPPAGSAPPVVEYRIHVSEGTATVEGRIAGRASFASPADSSAADELVLFLASGQEAVQKLGDVQGIVLEQAKFIASFFFVPVVIGLNWKRGNAPGAIAAMLGGFLACLAWELTYQESFPEHGIDAVEVGVGSSLVLFVVVSLLVRRRPARR